MPRVPFLLALLLCVPFVVGCEGCRRDTDPTAEDELEAPLEDFTAPTTLALPSDANPATGGIKPGHWMTASQSLKSNKVDSRGELQSRASVTTSDVATGGRETTEGEVTSLRPIVLPKGQLRRFDFRLLTPLAGNQNQNGQKRMYLSSRFISAGRTIFYDTGRTPFNVLSPEEYFFVILTSRPERFAKFQVSDWVRPFRDEYALNEMTAANYRILFPATDELLPLSETMLDWTSTAVVLWDDLSPDALTPYQQQAMSDWIRFGGKLIVNGADATDAISQTSLIDVLPLRPSGNIELDPDAAEEFLHGWSVDKDTTEEKQIAVMRSESGRVAVDGQLADGAEPLPNSGKLILTRRVGNGQVVQPRFDVTSDWLVNWQSYDSFVNAAMLGRPKRKFINPKDSYGERLVEQQYVLNDSIAGPARANSAMNTRFRITARDAVLPGLTGEFTGSMSATSGYDPYTHIGTSTGVGGWNDNSDAIQLCRNILKSESGIEIPDSSLVIRSLGYYLLILVPLNYLVFRIVGRLEYAWLAVPLIAVGGAIWVARAARLDIGFARKQTELAVLELQPEYHRGHLSRVIAIYNSLSSTYNVEFKTVDGVAAPIWDEQAGNSPVFKTGFAEGPILEGLSIDSNNTRLVHTEQMIDVGGGISLDAQGDLINDTDYELYDAFVVEKTDIDNVRVAMIGPCTPGSKVKLRFQDVATPAITDELPMQTIRMLRRLASPTAMRDDSMRMVARIDSSLPGMSIVPEANQADAQTIVLAHLKHAPYPTPEMDVNLVPQIRKSLGSDDDLLEENP